MGLIKKFITAINLESGRVWCDVCRKQVNFRDLEPLRLHPCPKCNAPVFIPRKIRNFWLYRPLGAGGYGAVYKAFRLWSLHDVAVKLLKAGSGSQDDDEKRVASLQREYDVGMKLKGNSHLVCPLDFGQDNADWFLVTEFVKGLRLDTIIRHIDQFPEEIAYQLILQVLDIEQYIYSCGYLYRDLKPENIIIDRKGRMKLLDYGLCLDIKEAENHSLSRDTIEGSPFYLPPERIAGMPEEQYSEIYSIGMLFYNMLSGKTFYKANSDIKDLIIKHIKSERLLRVKPQLQNCNTITGLIINRMISREPRERFHNYEVLKKSLLKAYKKVRKQNRKHISFRQFLDGIE